MKKIIFTSAILSIFAFGCDNIEGPYTEGALPIDTTQNTSTINQKVLIEEYTGHYCGNCPDGAIEVDKLKNTYGNKLITVSIHAGFFAKLKNAEGYTYDFRNTTGNELGTKYDIDGTGNPCAAIGRNPLDGKYLLTKTLWAQRITEALTNTAPMNIAITPSYNAATNTVNAKIDLDYLNAAVSEDNIVVYLIEDEIVAKQKWYNHTPEDVLDYKHKHVLRGSLNGTFGEAVAATIPTKGTKITKNYSIELKSGWNPANLTIVAFVANKATDAVLNANEAKVN